MLINFGRNFLNHERLFGDNSLLILCNPEPNFLELNSFVGLKLTKTRNYTSQQLWVNSKTFKRVDSLFGFRLVELLFFNIVDITVVLEDSCRDKSETDGEELRFLIFLIVHHTQLKKFIIFRRKVSSYTIKCFTVVNLLSGPW